MIRLSIILSLAPIMTFLKCYLFTLRLLELFRLSTNKTTYYYVHHGHCYLSAHDT